MEIDEVNYLNFLFGDEGEKRSKLASDIYLAFLSSQRSDDIKSIDVARLSFQFADVFIKENKYEKEQIREAFHLKQNGKNKLLQWANENGSTELKQNIATPGLSNLDTQKQASYEFLNFYLPEGFQYTLEDDYSFSSEMERSGSNDEDELATLNYLKGLKKDKPDIFKKIKLFSRNYANEDRKLVCFKHFIQIDVAAPDYSWLTATKQTAMKTF